MIDRQADRQIDRQTDRQMDRQNETCTDIFLLPAKRVWDKKPTQVFCCHHVVLNRHRQSFKIQCQCFFRIHRFTKPSRFPANLAGLPCKWVGPRDFKVHHNRGSQLWGTSYFQKVSSKRKITFSANSGHTQQMLLKKEGA